MKKILLLFLLALFLLSGCYAEEAESTAPETEETEEVIVTASESDYMYKIINGEVTVNQYIGGESAVVIPETIEGCPVRKIKNDFLKDSHVSEVTYPASFTVFSGLSNCPDLKVIRFSTAPERITEPFCFCEGLTEIDIPDGGDYRTVDGIVYTADGKTLVAYPRGRTGSFTVPADVEAIGQRAFCGSALSEIVFSDGVKTIGDYAFARAEKLTEVTVPASVRTIGACAFSESGIERITLSEGLEEIDLLAFEKTKITELYLPDSVVKCSSRIAEPEVLISASYPTEGLTSLTFHGNTEFRDETTLQEAFRKAEEQFFKETNTRFDGYVFMDLSGDGFPELLALIQDFIMWIYHYDVEAREWVHSSLDEYGATDYVPIDVYRLCYDDETDTYAYYSEPYDYYGNAEPTDWFIPRQDYIRITENGVMMDSLFGEEVKDLSKAEIIQTVDFPQMLADWNVDPDDSYQKFILVTDPFAEEPNGELQQKPLEIHGNWAEAYPYFESYYPKEMKLSVAGVDLLHGGELAGVSFNHGVLTLENAVIDSSGHDFTITASKLDTLTIELIGENKIVSDSSCSLFRAGDIPIVFKGSGSLEVPTMEAKRISLTESAKIITNAKLSSEKNDIITDSLSLSGESSLECREVKTDFFSLDDRAYMGIQSGRFGEMYLSDDSAMDVILNEANRVNYTAYRAITVGHCIRISDNARLFVDNSKHPVENRSDAIFFYQNDGSLTVSDNGTLEIKGNHLAEAINLEYTARGTLTVNGNAKVKIDGAGTCINAAKIILNGGTLELNAAEENPAIMIETVVLPYSDFESGYFINGEILSENISDREMLHREMIYDFVLCSDGKPVSSYFIQVREREQASEQSGG